MLRGSQSGTATIAICTHNRARLLEKCLTALMIANRTQGLRVVVVDNASTDETAEVLSRFPFCTEYEGRLGLSHARNRALEIVQTDYLVFLDDDALPEPEWCRAIVDGIEKYDPDVFGGPYTPFYLGSKPNWYPDDLGSAHLELSEGEQASSVCFSGGNMGWRVSILRELGGFDAKLGMVGRSLRLGEETALQLALRSRPDAKRVYLPMMRMKHYVPSEKMKLSYIASRSFAYGHVLIDIDREAHIAREATVLGFARHTKVGLPLVLRLLIRDRHRYPHWATFAARYLSLHMIEAGVLWRRLAGRPHLE